MRIFFVLLATLSMTALFADYTAEFQSELNPMQIGPSSDNWAGDYFAVHNTGDSDTFTLTTVVDSGPENCGVMFCDDQGSCYPGSHSFNLTAGATFNYHADVYCPTVGQIDYHFALTSTHITTPINLYFRYITDDVQVLVVDEDGVGEYASYYTDAIQTAGVTCGVWNRDWSPLTDEALASFDTFVWETGRVENAIGNEDATAMISMLDGGKHVFLAGQRIARDLAGSDPDFLHDYLHCTNGVSDSGVNDMVGLAGDPVTNGMTLVLNGTDCANNQTDRGVIEPRDAFASAMLNYSTGTCGALRIMHQGLTQAIFLDFGLEGVNTAFTRTHLMNRSLYWFGFTVGNEDHSAAPTPDGVALRNYPNPFNPVTTIAWSKPANGRPVDLTIYNLRGESVRTIAGLTTDSYQWNGTDDQGRKLASGTYFFRLKGGVETPTKKMVLLK
jgi:hypothetical protein